MKIMDKINILKCVFIFFLIWFLHCYTVQSNVVEQKMISDTINYCDVLKDLHESSYIAKCRELPYPTSFKNDTDLALCMIIFNTVNNICQNIVKEPKIKVPKSLKEIDDDIRNFLPKQSDYNSFIAVVCNSMVSIFNNWNTLDIKSNTNVDQYIRYASGTLLEYDECRYTCHKPNNTVNPLCMIFLWLNQILNKIKNYKSIPLLKKNITQLAVISDIIELKQVSPLEYNTKSHNNSIKNKIDDIVESTSSINNIFIKPNVNLISNSSRKQDNDSNLSIVHNEFESKKDIDIHTTEDKEKHASIFSTKYKINIMTDKPLENMMDNPNNIHQSEQTNHDKVFISNEDQSSKKINENKDDEGDEHDTINVLKESINNIGEDIFSSRNSGIQESVFQDVKKSYPPLLVSKEQDESHFFMYFSIITLVGIGLYVGYYNKQKILAMVVEGRRSRRGRGNRRRPSTANYHKLDCNLEEAVTSQCNSNATHVIY